jgi:hypothetical protein
MPLLSKASILSARDLPTETVPVPEWGGDVVLQGLTASQRDDLEASLVDPSGKITNTKAFRARLVAMSLVGEDGKPLFTLAEVADLQGKSAKVINDLSTVAQRLSGLTTSVDDTAKN